MFCFVVLILIIVCGASLLAGRSFWFENNKLKLFKSIFIFSLISIFVLNFYQSWQQYQTWSQNELSKHLLPPYQSINYFLFYITTRFFAPYLISLFAALLFFFSAKTINKKYEERFFYPEELWLAALAIFLVGHPAWLFYAVFIIFIYLAIFFINLSKKIVY